MKDNRTPIPKGTKINYDNSKQKIVFTVADVIGYGGSCIVYDAFYTDTYGIRHNCILKQLYPLYENADTLYKWDNAPVTESQLDRFLHASEIQKNISQENATVNTTSLLYSVFSYQDSVYFQCSEKNFGSSMDKIHFDNLHEYFFVLLQTARIISEYHQQGWLHLDIKPQNIFCKTSEYHHFSVLMFDFDSLIKTDCVADSSHVISCSRNYAPPEVLQGMRKNIGIFSDFYETGCMLFEKIFGRFPKSTEISGFKSYPWSESTLKNSKNSELLSALKDFFRHTITVSVKKRYQTDDDFVNALENLYQLSYEQKRTVVSNFTTPSIFFTGRKQETDTVRQKLLKNGTVIIQGVGGIGKSSLALHYADLYRDCYQTILYLEYHNSLDELIESDIQINGISEKLSLTEKMAVFRELVDNQTLVILDNLCHTNFETLYNDWISLPCHVIVTARSSQKEYHHFTVTLSGLEQAETLFYHYYPYPCSEEEKEDVNRLLYTIDSHTMMTELLGKFCCNYRIRNHRSPLAEVCQAFQQYNTNILGNEDIKQLKDWTPTKQSVQKHMDILFMIFPFNDEDKHILQFFSLLNLKSVSTQLFVRWYGKDSRSSLERLYGLGMIQHSVSDLAYKIHPLIAERILANYPPQAKDFIFTSEKMADSLLLAVNRNRKVLLTVVEHYTRHLCGIHISLAFLYQAMVSEAPKNQKKLFTEKALTMFSKIDDGSVPYFFQFQEIYDRYSRQLWSDDENNVNETLIDDLLALCETAISNLSSYRIVQNCQQIAKICGMLAEQTSVMLFDTEKEDCFFVYQIRFLEKALTNADTEEIVKKIADELHCCYNNTFSPIVNAVKAEQYGRIADAGIKFYDSATQERIDTSEQENIAFLMEAMRIEYQNEECLTLANLWYEKHIEENFPLDHYLRFQMECIYEENQLWERYVTLIQEESNNFDDKCSLQLGKGYYHLGMYDTAKKYLWNAEKYYIRKYSDILNDDTENYLLTLGFLALIEKSNSYEEKFFACAEKYYQTSLMQKADELALFCFSMCRTCLEKAKEKKAEYFLSLYARYRDTAYTEQQEYQDFQLTLGKLSTQENNFFWIKLFQADYLEYHLHSDKALTVYRDILCNLSDDSDLSVRYRQIVYQKIEKCNNDFFLRNFRSAINYELLYDIKMQGTDKTFTFDEIIGKKLDIVRSYEKIGSPHSTIVLQQILLEVNIFDGNAITCFRAYKQMENYFLSVLNIDLALSFALKEYAVAQQILSPEETAEICCSVAHAYHIKKDDERQFSWLEKAVYLVDNSNSNCRSDIEQKIFVHEKMLSFYEERHNTEMQITENKKLAHILASLTETRYEKKLEKVYHNLSDLFFSIHNFTQSYFYRTLEEQLIQKSIT